MTELDPLGNNWTLSEAIDLCVKVEAICPQFGCHVALTGGLLYKSGLRKDCDILFYRIRQVSDINQSGLFKALKVIGLDVFKGNGWCFKAAYQGKPVDIFFPEECGAVENIPNFESFY